MTKLYNYSLHSYCISFGFDEEQLYINRFFNGYRSKTSVYCNRIRSVAILIDIAKNEYFLGDEADKRKSETDDTNIFYKKNIFMALNEIYIKKKKIKSNEKEYIFDIHDTKIREGIIKYLKNAKSNYKIEIGNKDIPHLIPHYAFFVPTDWDREIREDIIRPLFVDAKLIEKDDHQSRLLFFNQLETTFQYLQSQNHTTPETKMNMPIVNGQQYIMYGLKFTENVLSVRLDVFSAHYPSIQSIGNNYITKSLESINFTIPLDSDVEEGIKVCVKNCLKESTAKNTEETEEIETEGAEEAENTKKIVDLLLKHYSKQSHPYNNHKNLSQLKMHEDQPFKNLPKEIKIYTNDKQREILESITMKQIHANLFTSIQETFKKKVEKESKMSEERDRRRTAILLLIKINDLLVASLKYKFDNFTAWMVFNWLKEWLIELGQQEIKYKLMTFGEDKLPSFDMPWTDMQEGNNLMIKDQIQLSSANMPPEKIIASKLDYCKVVSPIPLEQSKINYFINIAISAETISSSYAYLGDDTLTKSIKMYSECDIKPLHSFINPVCKYQKSIVLCIPKYLKEFINGNKKSPIDIMSHIKNCLVNNEMMKFFSKSKVIEEKATDSENTIVFLSKEDQIRTFLLLYLGYFNKLLKEQINESYGNDWNGKKIGYVVSVEKMLIDKVFSTKKKLIQLLHQSDILPVADKCTRSKVITQGEIILSAVEKELDIPLSLKSYFITAQINEDYIQVTLHQVVKIKEDKTNNEDPCSIVVKDKTIPIENIRDTLCKAIWNYLKASKKATGCDHLIDTKCYNCCDVFSIENYNKVFIQLKKGLSEIFSSNDRDLLLKHELNITISAECSFNIALSLYHIFDIALQPVIKNITTIIAASIVEPDFFGKYIIDFILVLGNIYGISDKSPLGKRCHLMLQSSLDDSIELKEKDINAHVIQESIYQIFLPVKDKKPHLYDTLIKGNMNQVAMETYAIYVKRVYKGDVIYSENELRPFLSCKNNESSIIGGRDSAMIIVQKGQIIPIGGFIKQFMMDDRYFADNENTHGYQLEIDLIRLNSLDNNPLDEIICLNGHYYDIIDCFSLHRGEKKFETPIRLEIKHVNYCSSLQFSFRMMGDSDDYHNPRLCIAVGEQLTVAYS